MYTITFEGTEIVSSVETTAMYCIQNKWYLFEPRPEHSSSPRTLAPNILPIMHPEMQPSMPVQLLAQMEANITVDKGRALSDAKPWISQNYSCFILLVCRSTVTIQHSIQIQRIRSRLVHPTILPYAKVVLRHINEMLTLIGETIRFPVPPSYSPAIMIGRSVTPAPDNDCRIETLDLQSVIRRLHLDTLAHYQRTTATPMNQVDSPIAESQPIRRTDKPMYSPDALIVIEVHKLPSTHSS